MGSYTLQVPHRLTECRFAGMVWMVGRDALALQASRMQTDPFEANLFPLRGRGLGHSGGRGEGGFQPNWSPQPSYREPKLHLFSVKGQIASSLTSTHVSALVFNH